MLWRPFSFFRGERIGAHGAPYATTTGYSGSWVGCAVRTNAVRLVRGRDCRWRQAPGRAVVLRGGWSKNRPEGRAPTENARAHWD